MFHPYALVVAKDSAYTDRLYSVFLFRFFQQLIEVFHLILGLGHILEVNIDGRSLECAWEEWERKTLGDQWDTFRGHGLVHIRIGFCRFGQVAQTNGLVVEQGGEEEVVQGVFAPTNKADKSHDKIIYLITSK